jgi:hypothetical protein
MFIACSLLIILKMYTTRASFAREMINVLWYSHTVEYYSVTKTDEVLICAATLEDLECMVLSE